MGSSEPSQEYENFFDIVLQSVGHPPGRYGIRFGLDCVPPTISLQLLGLWRWHIYFFFFDGPPVVQQLVAILVLLQEMSGRPSTPPSCYNSH